MELRTENLSSSDAAIAHPIPDHLMSPSSTPNDSDCQSAAEHLERLEAWSRRAGEDEADADDFYRFVEQTIAEVTGKEGRFALETPSRSVRLGCTGSSENLDSAAGGVHSQIESVALARYRLTNRDSIVFKVEDSIGQPLLPWQESFIDAATDCVATVYLKRRYLESTGSSSDPRRARSTNFKRAVWLLVVTAAALFVPVPFRIAIEGSVMPVEQVGIFAPSAGNLVSLEVRDSQTIRKGDVLARIDSPEIELQRDRLRGELLAAQTELSSLRITPRRSTSSPTPTDDSTSVSSDRSANASSQTAVLRVRIASLERQVELIDQVHASLTIRATNSGSVVIRESQSTLVGQHVMQSQWLMSVIDPTAGCRAVIDLPSDAFGYLPGTNADDTGPLTVALRLRSNPSRSFTGQVAQIGNTVHYRHDGNGFVPITVSLDSGTGSLPVDEFRTGAPVVGHLSFGTRPLGFVFFRPVVEVIRSWGW
ncbi:efflux RND transporter periplasmic adaptor subunit [Neorhodopirellula pilleata]|uniref:Multidrug resistance protein MdtN n=1 Tax=Neorhodopirellula pilleata TaxID=2714738 RepID=A0A5C5ZKQ9_9BACT|nr:biotin/lipoyl-binding protein [Neorhodopirellula pilleata]TWT87959.1 multidrug resistance protein MdtN [Neorhodopirellula pilleata]